MSEGEGALPMCDKVPDAEIRVGLGPRLIAAVWFGFTACIPIVVFFEALYSPNALIDKRTGPIFVVLPLCLATFFGFTIGSQILDDRLVMRDGTAALWGVVVAVASYAGMMAGYTILGSIGVRDADPFKLLISFLAIAGIGAVFLGWLIVIAGAISGWLLFRLAWSGYEALAISWISKDAASRLNLWAANILLITGLLCWGLWD
jgi:hypothetical protein